MVKAGTLDRTLSAVADPTRREILHRLAEGPASLTALAQPLQISVPGLLKHVRVLEDVRLVETRKRGRTRECHLGPSQLDDVSEWVEGYRRRWHRRLDRLETYLDRKKDER